MTDDSRPTPEQVAADEAIRRAFPGLTRPLRQAAFVVWLPDDEIRQWIKRDES